MIWFKGDAAKTTLQFISLNRLQDTFTKLFSAQTARKLERKCEKLEKIYTF